MEIPKAPPITYVYDGGNFPVAVHEPVYMKPKLSAVEMSVLHAYRVQQPLPPFMQPRTALHKPVENVLHREIPKPIPTGATQFVKFRWLTPDANGNLVPKENP